MPFCKCGNYYSDTRQKLCDECLLNNFIEILIRLLKRKEKL
jgi:NMD protein affecting ribosome stability and mRNA decay